MKKIFTFTFIFSIVLASIFSIKTSPNQKFHLIGYVSEKPYNFKIINEGNDLNSIDFIESNSITLNETSNTSEFVVLRSNGNSSQSLAFEVNVQTSSFTETVDEKIVYDTNITPEVIWNHKDYTYSGRSNNSQSRITSLPTGYKGIDKKVASFKLHIEGDEQIPEGNYKSTITVNYTYDI
jgi:hypothetical protein